MARGASRDQGIHYEVERILDRCRREQKLREVYSVSVEKLHKSLEPHTDGYQMYKVYITRNDGLYEHYFTNNQDFNSYYHMAIRVLEKAGIATGSVPPLPNQGYTRWTTNPGFVAECISAFPLIMQELEKLLTDRENLVMLGDDVGVPEAISAAGKAGWGWVGDGKAGGWVSWGGLEYGRCHRADFGEDFHYAGLNEHAQTMEEKKVRKTPESRKKSQVAKYLLQVAK